MKADSENKRQAAQSLGEYLAAFGRSQGVFRWINRELITPESMRFCKHMIGFLTISILLQSLQPLAMGYIFTGLTDKKLLMVEIAVGLFIATILLQKVAQRYQELAREKICGIHMGTLDKRFTQLFFEKSMGQHIHEGHKLSVANIDKGRWKIIELQGLVLFEAIPTIMMLLFSIAALFFFSLSSGLVMIAVIVFYIAWSFYLNFHIHKELTPLDKAMRALNRRRLERLENIARVKFNGKDSQELSEMTTLHTDLLKKDVAFWFWYLKTANWRSLIHITGLLIIVAYGSHLVWLGTWPIGALYPLFTWTMRISENIWRLGDIEHKLNWALPTVESMVDAMSIKPDIVTPNQPTIIDLSAPPLIEFIDIGHTFPVDVTHAVKEAATEEEDCPVLRKVTFTLEPGEKIALLGQSGAGKSTIMNILLRAIDPTVGEVRINGANLKDIDLINWYSNIGYIPQQSQIFDGTLRYNLIYGLPPERQKTITDEELWTLMKSLQIDFGLRLTHGLDTLVGKNGLKLSGGQAQRLAIGAAVIKNPTFMLIDEATSALDSTTEKQVQAGLQQILTKDTGALIVAHRLSTVRKMCTKFVVIKPASEIVNGDNQVEAIGSSFEELWAKSPTFRELATDQGLVIEA